MLNQFHFLQPYWLLALMPLAIVWWLMARTKVSDFKAWSKVIDANLLPLLLSGSNEKHSSSYFLGKSMLAIGWVVATLALADPAWEKIPRPVFQTNAARVIVLDLSSSMLIDDLKPSRLARARFKIEDILSNNFTKKEEGQIGLVLFAGDAFTASPLTRDSETIRALLQVLTPRIMPSQGSRVDLGLKKAHELLTQAGVEKGQILLIADGLSDKEATLNVVKNIRKGGHTLSVLGIGTEAGGVLPAIKYNNGDDIVVKLQSKALQELAQEGGGKYHLISTNNADLQSVLSKPMVSNKPQEKSDDVKREDWKSTGPLILLLLLPLAALAFRRGWLFTVFISLSLFGLVQPQPASAAEAETPQDNSFTQTIKTTWESLWKNKEQRASLALQNKQYDEVDTLSNKPLMRGSAKYKKDDYKGALKEFKQVQGADARYNEGNALAKLEKYEDAIKAYDDALKLQPEMNDAKKNKELIKKLLEQKKKQDHKKSDSDKKQKEGKSKDNKNQQQKDSKNNKDSDKNNADKSKQKNDGKKGKKKEGQNKKGNKSDNQFSDANKALKQNKKDSTKDQKQEEATDKKPEKKSVNSNKEKKQKLDKNLPNPKDKGNKKEGTNAEAEELNKEEKMAAEQWLRRIPDDPGGLLRQKFLRQYRQRKRPANIKQPW